MICAVNGCSWPATHRAELVICTWTDQVHAPAVRAMDLRVCFTHATDELARAVLIAAAGHIQIAGRVPPDWRRSFVRWVEL